MPGMYAVTSMPEVSRTRATLRSAELGFFGVCGEHARAHAAALGRALQRRGLRLLRLASPVPCGRAAGSWARVSSIRLVLDGTWLAGIVISRHAARRGRSAVHRRQSRPVRRSSRARPRRSVGSSAELTSAIGPPNAAAPSTRRDAASAPPSIPPPLGEDAESVSADWRARVASHVREVEVAVGVGRVEGQRLVVGRLGARCRGTRHAGTRRDELADDHVLLEPEEAVAAALDGRLGEHAGGLLERRRRQPRVGGERRLGDPHELGTTLGGLLALGHEATVRRRRNSRASAF